MTTKKKERERNAYRSQRFSSALRLLRRMRLLGKKRRVWRGQKEVDETDMLSPQRGQIKWLPAKVMGGGGLPFMHCHCMDWTSAPHCTEPGPLRGSPKNVLLWLLSLEGEGYADDDAAVVCGWIISPHLQFSTRHSAHFLFFSLASRAG